MERIIHPISPFYNKDSKILILGSFPSVKSRESGFYYAHPRNRFWTVLSGVFGYPIPSTVEEKKKMLTDNRVALWDIIGSCRIEGSSDMSICDVIPNDIGGIIRECGAEAVFLNGKTSAKYFEKFIADKVNVPYTVLPSTSPANASYTYGELLRIWKDAISGHIQ